MICRPARHLATDDTASWRARPFDEKGFRINYTAKANYQESSESWSPRLGFYASNTWDTSAGEFGILGGVAYSNRKYRSDGFNTIGFTTVATPGCPTTQPGCNSQNLNGTAANPTPGYGTSAQIWSRRRRSASPPPLTGYRP